MHNPESISDSNEISLIPINRTRGDKVLKVVYSAPESHIDQKNKLALIEISPKNVAKKIKKNQGIKKLITSTIIGITAAISTTMLSGQTVKGEEKNITTFSSNLSSGISKAIEWEPLDEENSVDFLKNSSETPLEDPPTLLVDDDSSVSKTPLEPTSSSHIDVTELSEIESDVEPIINESVPESITQSHPIANGLDSAIKTAFSEGAYNSEEEARKISDVIINRALNKGTSVGAEVSNGEFEAYEMGMRGKGNWGWREYGSGPQKGSIGTERVQQIFMEELEKAISGQPLTYEYTSFGASGDGKTNIFR